MTASIDPSLRFVLPDDAPFVANLAALWATQPKLAAAIESLPEEARHTVEPSKVIDAPTVSVTTAAGKTLSLHSRYQPIDEASRLIVSIDFDQRIAFYVYGFGLGYHVEKIFERASDEAIVVVFEPDLVMLKTAMEARDLSKLIESERVLFFWNADKAELFTRLTAHSAILSLGVESVMHAPSVQLHSEFHQQFQTWTSEYAAFCKTSLNTLVLNGRRTAENVTRNVAWYAATPSVERLANHYAGKPAIVVSAGPSLRKNKHLLKDVNDRAVIVAVQTTLQPLLEIGVEPHFVTSLDYHDICSRFFEKLPPNLKTELVAEPKATSAIFKLNPGPVSIIGNDYAEKLLREMRLNKAKLSSGATVAHLAFYLAQHLGCDPIIFVGQDLGFSDGLCYSPGTSYEDVWRPELSRFCTLEMKQWEQVVRDRHILRRIVDSQGRPMYTEERLFTYLQQFERDFSESPARVIDATEGGAFKRGSTPMTLAEAIERFCREPLGAAPPPHAGMNWQTLEQCLRCLENRRDEAQDIAEISRQTLPLLQEICDHLDEQSRVNRAIANIDRLRARMNELGPTYDLITQITQKTELSRFHADRKISASKVSGTELQRRQVKRDIDNVRAVLEAAEEFARMMSDAVAHLQASSPESKKERAA